MSGPSLAIITQQFWPLTGGRLRFLANLAQSFAERGAKVTVVTRRWHDGWPARFAFNDVWIERLPQRRMGLWRERNWRQAVNCWLKQHGHSFDTIIAASLSEGPPVVQGAGSAGYSAFVQRDHAFTRSASRRCSRHIEFRCLESAAAIVSIDARHTQIEVSLHTTPKTLSLPVAVPLRKTRGPEDRRLARAALADLAHDLRLADEAYLAICVPETFDLARVHIALVAWTRVVARRPAARLWLLGRYARERGLRAAIETMGLSAVVQLPGEFDDLTEVFNAADAYLALDSTFDSWNLAEASAAGLQCIWSGPPPPTRRQINPGVVRLPVRATESDWAEAIEGAFISTSEGQQEVAGRPVDSPTLPRWDDLVDAYWKLLT